MLNQENKKLHLMEKTILSFGLMAVMAIGLVSMKGTGRPVVRVAGRQAAIRASVGAVVDTVPAVSGKKPGAAVKAPVGMTYMSDSSAATMAGAVMTIANPKSATAAPVAVVGEPVAPVTNVVIV